MKIIPSIDLMDGEAVQLVNGRPDQLKVREKNIEELANKFSTLGVINVIDLDAAFRKGDNRKLIQQIASKYKVNVGGGIRTVGDAKEILNIGAEKVILGSSLYSSDGINRKFIDQLLSEIDADRLIFAIDCKEETVCSHGWEQSTGLNVFDVVDELGKSCSELLSTCVGQEGTMNGPDLTTIEKLVDKSPVPIIAAGGIGSIDDIIAVCQLGASVVLGMCLYTGRVTLEDIVKIRL